MTDAELARTLDARKRAWLDLDASHLALGAMPPELRRFIDDASFRFRIADAAITAELRRRPGPVRVGVVELWLTVDRQNFAEVDPATGLLVHRTRGDPGAKGRAMLYDYGRGKAGARS